MEAHSPIRSLREKPYDLLVALDRRGQAASGVKSENPDGEREWVGVAWRMAGESTLFFL